MNAMILAAGKGTRLLPLTKEMPKCMIPIGDKPLIEHQIIWLRENGIKKIAINLHHFPEKIKEYLGNGSKLGVYMTYSFENELLGTSGGVKNIEEFFEENFIIFYGDEITDMDLNELLRFHKKHNSDFTMCIREKPKNSSASNTIILDNEQRIIKFVEKPTKNNPDIRNLANCGIYLCNRSVLDLIPKNKFSDFGYDIIPKLVEKQKVFGYELPKNNYWYEVGSIKKHEACLQALKEKKII